jgi:hypothetical protein
MKIGLRLAGSFVATILTALPIRAAPDDLTRIATAINAAVSK